MHATVFLKQPDKPELGPLVVLHGGESYLKQAALQQLVVRVVGGEEGMGVVRFAGKEANFRDVRDELQLVSMFTPRKLVVVDDADDFVTNYRSQLEEYVDRPARQGLLVLNLKSWRKNTRLAKKLDQSGLELDCGELTGTRLTEWLIDQAKNIYGKQLTRDAAALIPTLAGTGLTLLDQELQKLVSYVGDRARIGAEEVGKLVGGWKGETTWTMINAIRDGTPGVALTCLDKLLRAGEPAPKILGGVNFVFRKFCLATERARTGVPLRAALESSGVHPRELDAAEKYLRRIRRPRAERIVERLVAADYNLKGGSPIPERMQMELLVLWLCGSTPL